MATDPAAGPPRPARRVRVVQAARRLTLDVSPLRRSHDFRLLFYGEAVGVVGSQVRLVAIPYLVYLITHSSLAVGLVSLAQFVPTLLFALAGGAVADVVDRRRLLLVTQTLTAICAGLLAVPTLLATPPLWYLVVVVTLAAGVQAVDSPTRRAVIPSLVGQQYVAGALALEQVTSQLGSVLGPAVAGVLIARFGVGPALAVNLVTAAVSLVMIALVAPMPPIGRQPEAKRGLSAIHEGFAYLADKPALVSTFVIDLNAMIFGGPQALFPALATQIYRTGPLGLGLLYAAPGMGAFIGALFTGWVGRVRHQGRAVILAVAAWGLAIALFGLATRSFWLGLVLLAVAGAADMFSTVFRGTILQLAVPDRLRGRLSSVHYLVVTSGPRLGDVEAGGVAALATTQISVVSGGLASLVGALVVALAIPAFWRYDAQRDLAAED